MLKIIVLSLAALLGTVGLACSGSATTAGCCILPTSRCLEYEGADYSGPEQSCELGIGTWVDGTCSRDEAIGGCLRNPAPGATYTLTIWYYRGTTDASTATDGGASDPSTLCGAGETYVAP